METTTARPAVNPFRDESAIDDQDADLVAEAKAGSTTAIEELVRRHQAFLYNVALRMLYHPQDAEDATQEILIKAITKLSTFEGRSRFRTWLYRIATNHLLNMKRGRMEPETLTFAEYGHNTEMTPELDLPDLREVSVDVRLLIDEARIGCTTAMLLCLDREQRLAYILGEIMGAADRLAGDVLGISREAFRQRLARARRDLHSFMNGRCGLVDRAKPCRCDRKTRGFMQAGYVDPGNLLFARTRMRHMREMAERRTPGIASYEDLCVEIFRDHPFYEPQDLSARIRDVIDQPDFQKTFGL
jgi:RNA polymerase sigma factor (sigma-70 family)